MRIAAILLAAFVLALTPSASAQQVPKIRFTLGGDAFVAAIPDGCMTSVGNRAFVVFFYAGGNDPATVKQLVAKARAFAVSVRVRR